MRCNNLTEALDFPTLITELHLQKESVLLEEQLVPFENLEELILEDCEFYELPKSIFLIKGLSFLTIKNTVFQSIDWVANSSIESIEFIGCTLRTFPAFYHLEALREFFLKDCRFTCFNSCLEGSYPNLKIVEISGLKGISTLTFNIDSTPILNQLTIENSAIKTVLIQAKEKVPLQYLTLTKLKSPTITFETTAGALDQLKVLKLNNNELKQLPFLKSNPCLRGLDISNNPLGQCDLQSFNLSCLNTLDLEGCGLKEIPRIDAAKYTLVRINIAHNNIEDISYLCGFQSLICIRAGYNKLEQVPVCFFAKEHGLFDLSVWDNKGSFPVLWPQLKEKEALISALPPEEKVTWLLSKYLQEAPFKEHYNRLVLPLLCLPLTLRKNCKQSYKNLLKKQPKRLIALFKNYIKGDLPTDTEIHQTAKKIHALF